MEDVLERKSTWITHDQLDTPLCKLFPHIRTTATTRLYIKIACSSLDVQPKNLSVMTYEELNKYIEELNHLIEEL